MIQLTETETLYPPRPIPTFWEWEIRIIIGCIGIIVLLVWWYFKKRSMLQMPAPTTIALEIDTKKLWLEELMHINTSIRTPHQKAEAILNHLLFYLGIEKTEQTNTRSYTLAELQTIPGGTALIPFFEQLYEIIYTDKKITHAQINTFTQRLLSHCSGI